MTAAAVLVDAWFDVATSGRGASFAVALATAVVVELPVSAACLRIAFGARPPRLSIYGQPLVSNVLQTPSSVVRSASQSSPVSPVAPVSRRLKIHANRVWPSRQTSPEREPV